MKKGIFKTKFASLVIGIPAGVPRHLKSGIREISSITVSKKHRGKGHASDLIRAACAQADAAKITLMLMPKPFGDEPMTGDQLEAWYTRFGFGVIQQEPTLMARAPNIARVLKTA